MDPNISRPEIDDALDPLTPGGGVILTYGMQARFARPDRSWTLGGAYDASPLASERSSRAQWERGRETLILQVAEYDSLEAAGDGLARYLAKNQLVALPPGPAQVGEISYQQPAVVEQMIYFVRANLVAIVSGNAGRDAIDPFAAAVDQYILQYPAKPQSATFRYSVSGTGTTYALAVSPAQPPTGFFYKFWAGGASLARESGVTLATLLSGISETHAQIFLVDGDATKTSATPAFSLPPRLV
ncbi:MAG TPA: hypothetical protein VF432_11180 [Thermoanaerobaculia bacterium]